MNELASIILVVSTLSVPPVVAQDVVQTRPWINSVGRLAQVQTARMCLTKFGSCPIPPRPAGTQCYCGNVAGVAR
jgi:hypothetical protein